MQVRRFTLDGERDLTSLFLGYLHRLFSWWLLAGGSAKRFQKHGQLSRPYTCFE